MYKNMKILAVITARGGSKAVPNKNIHPLCGKPLIAYTCEAALKSQHLTTTIVSTDDEGIAELCRQNGVEVPFVRPAEFATDRATSISVLKHALDHYHQKGQGFDYVMILQPTSPLRTSEDIDACIEKIVDLKADSVMSMVEIPDFSPNKLKAIRDDKIYPLLTDEGKQSDFRQNATAVYKRNCAVYLTKVKLIQQGDLFGSESIAYVMPEDRSVDINSKSDFDLAEFYMTRNK